MEIRYSGPRRLAVFDECSGCNRSGCLYDPKCRGCVLKQLGIDEEGVDRVVLKKTFHHTYTSRKLWELARVFAAAEQKLEVLPEGSRATVEKALEYARSNPHDLEFVGKVPFLAPLYDRVASLVPSREQDYGRVFGEFIKPFFVQGLWLGSQYPLIPHETYRLESNRGTVRIYEQVGSPAYFYELDLPEFRLPYHQVSLLHCAYESELREVPETADLTPERSQRFLEDTYFRRLRELSPESSPEESRRLARLLVNWQSFGVFEPLAYDDEVTDVDVDPPAEDQSVVIEHQRYGRCDSGIYLDTPSLLGFADRLASDVGRRFDDHNPNLDAEIPKLGLRVFATRLATWIKLNIRRRRFKPWTQPLFIWHATLTPLASAFLSIMLRQGTSAVIFGDMGTAKTSQVETYVPEIGRAEKIIVFQDTEELHIHDFVNHKYRVVPVWVQRPEQLAQIISAFLRGGSAYWLITEVREPAAVKSAFGAAARHGQPVILSMHARSRREMFSLVTEQMGITPEEFKFADLLVSTVRIKKPSGSVRRIAEIAEVRKDWREEPEYVDLFVYDPTADAIRPETLLCGNGRTIKKLNSGDLSRVRLSEINRVGFVQPEKGGSQLIQTICDRRGMEEDELLIRMFLEARVKSDLVRLARARNNTGYLELPFVSAAYDVYFSLLKSEVEPDRVLRGWSQWLGNA